MTEIKSDVKLFVKSFSKNHFAYIRLHIHEIIMNISLTFFLLKDHFTYRIFILDCIRFIKLS